MKVRVKPGNRYGDHGAGTVLDVDPAEVALHPHCFEDEGAHQQRLLKSRTTRMRLTVVQQQGLGLTPTGTPEGDWYEVVRLDEGTLPRAELARQLQKPGGEQLDHDLVGKLITAVGETAKAMGFNEGEDGEAADYVAKNVERAFSFLRRDAEDARQVLAAEEESARRRFEAAEMEALRERDVLQKEVAELRAELAKSTAVQPERPVALAPEKPKRGSGG